MSPQALSRQGAPLGFLFLRPPLTGSKKSEAGESSILRRTRAPVRAHEVSEGLLLSLVAL